MEGENSNLKLFLLGNAAEDQMNDLGARIIADPDFEEQMSLAEETLIEDFLDNQLSAEEKELFYKNYLTTEERIERVKETASLRSYAKNQLESAITAVNKKNSSSFPEKLKAFLSLNLRPIAAVLVITIIGAIIWRVAFYKDNKLSELEKTYAALNQKDLGTAPEAIGLTTKNLISGTFRDTNSGAGLNNETLTENVLFRLSLPGESEIGNTVGLELIRSDQTVFRQNDLRVYRNQNGREVKVILPKSVLSKGIYQIKLSNGVSYNFTVE